jgi:4-amino-4-deoxy-L-arabinose transferase-like glycosyltransferase
MQNKLNSFFSRYEFLLPLFIFLLFLAAALPGISWGAPALWNPDELVWRVDMALGGYMQFDVTEPDYNYPSLPKYIMYLIGWVTYGLGRETFAFIVAARSFSAFLGAVAGVLIYYLARKIGINKRFSVLAGLFYVFSGVAAANGRFAHNDLYLQFFTILCLYFVVYFQITKSKFWLLASFVAVGMATSSKYNGAIMILLPVSVFFFMNWSIVSRDLLRTFGMIIVGGLLVIFGYGIGTPRLFLATAEYLTKAIPAALRHSEYGFNSGSPLGLFGQWAVFENAVGMFFYYLFLSAIVWCVFRLVLKWFGRTQMDEKRAASLTILILNLAVFDLPYLISVNYSPRHFIPFVPIVSILGAMFVEDVVLFVKDRGGNIYKNLVLGIIILGMSYSLLRLVSFALLFINDARIEASSYISSIRGYGKSIEYTLYPPIINKKQFMRAHNYPIYFVKYKDDKVPTGGRLEYNLGKKGLLDRETDFFVIDSYTYERFYTDSICETNPVECDFFKRLLAGEETSYRLIGEFTYRLPLYLPQVDMASVNPDILIFERVP